MIKPPASPLSEELALGSLKTILTAAVDETGTLAEIAGIFLNPIEARRQRWMERVSEALNTIERKFNRLPQDLQSDPAFVSILIQATGTAVKNHRKEKIEALQNGIVSSLDRERFPEDSCHLFLRYIDELTVSHLSILASLLSCEGRLAAIESLPELHAAIDPKLEHPLEVEAFRLFVFDLDTRALIARGDIYDLPTFASKQEFSMLESSTFQPLQVTAMGKSFLQFIASSKSD
ncbi:hypothetical protein [Variovorax sp. V116]|uniref:hypothetical protein n=1 Tax=Variovorax sp. V116 TaxID=3065953 RepID=UPI0034E8886F